MFVCFWWGGVPDRVCPRFPGPFSEVNSMSSLEGQAPDRTGLTPSCAIGLADRAVDPGEVSVRSLVWPEAGTPQRLVLPRPMQHWCPSFGDDAGNILPIFNLTPDCAIGLANRAADPGEIIARPEAAQHNHLIYSPENLAFLQNFNQELSGVAPLASVWPGQEGRF